MDDAPLHLTLGIDREAFQTVHTEQIDVQNSPAFEVVQHIQPEFAALMLPNPYTQNVLCTIHGNTQNHICCFRLVLVVLLHLVMNSVQKHERKS